MASDKRTGLPAPEWWKHLRPYNKRKFWGKVRTHERNRLRTGPAGLHVGAEIRMMRDLDVDCVWEAA